MIIVIPNLSYKNDNVFINRSLNGMFLRKIHNFKFLNCIAIFILLIKIFWLLVLELYILLSGY